MWRNATATAGSSPWLRGAFALRPRPERGLWSLRHAAAALKCAEAEPRAARRPAQVSCGQSHCLAVSSDGRAFAWGAARHGRLGLGAATVAALPRDPADRRDAYAAAPAPIPALGGVRVVCVAAGLKHSLACDTAGVCYAWGLARYGRLGLDDWEALPTEAGPGGGGEGTGGDARAWHQATPTAITALRGVTVAQVAPPHRCFCSCYCLCLCFCFCCCCCCAAAAAAAAVAATTAGAVASRGRCR